MANSIFAGLFLLVGILLIRSSLNVRRKISESRRWPSVVGRLGEIGIVERRKGSGSRSRFLLKFTYEYEVGGRTYKGDEDRIRFSRGDARQSKASAQQRADEVKGKVPFLVFYDPSKPAESVLFQEDPSAATKIFIAGLISLALGAIILVGTHPDIMSALT